MEFGLTKDKWLMLRQWNWSLSNVHFKSVYILYCSSCHGKTGECQCKDKYIDENCDNSYGMESHDSFT